MILILCVVLLVLALGGGAWASPRYGYASWSPLGVILVVLLVLWLFGYVR